MLNSGETEIFPAQNAKIPTVVDSLRFISRINHKISDLSEIYTCTNFLYFIFLSSFNIVLN